MSPPPRVRVMTCVASSENRTCSGDTTSTRIVAPPSAGLLLQLLGLGQHLLDAADVEERLLGHVVEVAADDGLEALDGLGDRHGLTRTPVKTSAT